MCAEGEASHFVLPFFFALRRREGNSEGTAAGHLEVPHCTDSASTSTPENRQTGETKGDTKRGTARLTIRLLAGGPLEDVTVTVFDPRVSGSIISRQANVTLLAAGDYAFLGVGQ